MADVENDGTRFWRGRDRRGQMMVVMSLALAVLFVAMALYLNTAIYTENQATQKADISGAGGAVSYVEEAEAGIGGAIIYVNKHNHPDADPDVDDRDDMEDELEPAIDHWSDTTQQLEATRGRSVNISLAGTTDGTWIVQDDHDREFRNADDEVNWTVVEDTSNVRSFEMNVTQNALEDDHPGVPFGVEDIFTVTFEDENGNVRHLYIYAPDQDDVTVEVIDGGGNVIDDCQVDDNPEWAHIDLVEGHIVSSNGETDTCAFLVHRLFDELSGTYSIEYEYGEMVEGTYEFVAEEATVDQSNYNSYDDSPYTTEAIYSADIHVVYESPRISYETEIRVAPGEPDA